MDVYTYRCLEINPRSLGPLPKSAKKVLIKVYLKMAENARLANPDGKCIES